MTFVCGANGWAEEKAEYTAEDGHMRRRRRIWVCLNWTTPIVDENMISLEVQVQSLVIFFFTFISNASSLCQNEKGVGQILYQHVSQYQPTMLAICHVLLITEHFSLSWVRSHYVICLLRGADSIDLVILTLLLFIYLF